MDNLRSVVRLAEVDVPEVVGVLCESFLDYPVMRFVLGADPEVYERRLTTLIHYFVMARILRGEAILGVADSGGLSGVALVSRPAGPGDPPALSGLRESTWVELGVSARTRYESFEAVCARSEVAMPHIFLDMIGVRRAAQGAGLGGRLMQRVHAISFADPDSGGVKLTTEIEANISLYQHFGYEVVGRAIFAPGMTTWSLFRPDPDQ